MPTSNRKQQRPTTTCGRVGRSAGQGAGAPGRGGMPRRSAPRTPRTLNLSRQRKPQPSAKGNALQAVTGLLAGSRKPARTSQSAGKAGKAGAGVAVLTAAAGVAFKNPDKGPSLCKPAGAIAASAPGRRVCFGSAAGDAEVA